MGRKQSKEAFACRYSYVFCQEDKPDNSVYHSSGLESSNKVVLLLVPWYLVTGKNAR